MPIETIFYIFIWKNNDCK